MLLPVLHTSLHIIDTLKEGNPIIEYLSQTLGQHKTVLTLFCIALTTKKKKGPSEHSVEHITTKSKAFKISWLWRSKNMIGIFSLFWTLFAQFLYAHLSITIISWHVQLTLSMSLGSFFFVWTNLKTKQKKSHLFYLPVSQTIPKQKLVHVSLPILKKTWAAQVVTDLCMRKPHSMTHSKTVNLQSSNN